MTTESAIVTPVRAGKVKSKTQEVKILTLLRGYASLSVFLFHLICVSGGFITSSLLMDIFHFGKFGVQFFFVISGFVITWSMLQAGYKVRNFFTFLKKRFIRIEPPYVAIVVLTFIFLYVRVKSGLGTANMETPDWRALLLHFGYLIPFSDFEWFSIVFWTLAVEFQFYILFSLLLPVFTGKIWARWIPTVVLLTIACTMGNGMHFIDWSPVFLLGIFLALYKKKLIQQKEFWIASVLFLSAIFYRHGWEVLVFSVIPFFMIYFEPQIRSRFWEFFGRISYSLYLSHTLVGFAMINLGIRFNVEGNMKILVVAATIAVTVFFSYLLYYFVEKPCKQFAASIKYS